MKVTKFFGIDISKDVFDVCSSEGKHFQFTNNSNGYNEFATLLDQCSHCVMEATGAYHQRLAVWLHEHHFIVSVINPLVIKRFAQMKLRIAKTDKADARIIQAYAQQNSPFPWMPPQPYVEQSLEIQNLIDLLIKQRTALKNQLHSLESKGNQYLLINNSIQQSILNLDEQLKLLQAEMESLIKKNQSVLFNNLCSIPGIGKKTAMFLIVVTNAFKNFNSSKQLSAFLGLAPTIRISGKSVRGQSRISKAGNSSIRNLLFMCSFTASQSNKACRELFERIVAKGKSKKLALIAVANKLLKQAFAIAKSGMMFKENYGLAQLQ